METWATGIFTSISGGLGAGLDAAKRLRVPTVHLHAPGPEWRSADKVRQIREQFTEAGIAITVVFAGFADDDYTSVDRVKETVGLVPTARRATRLAQTLEIADFAAALGVEAIGMHLGFVCGDSSASGLRQVVEVARTVCDHCRSQGQYFHLETGQETAAELSRFIDAVERDELAVNFDPANMILYRSGEPLAALEVVGRHVRSVHCKDASWERKPGQAWHEDAPLGTGDVGIEPFLRKLRDLGYTGPLTIEREYSPDQSGDIEAALRLLERLRAMILS